MRSSPYKYTLFWGIQILFLLPFFSCNNKQFPSVSSTTSNAIEPAQILYLTLEALTDTLTNIIQVKIIQQTVVNGTLKPQSILQANPQAGNWKISMFTEKDKQISSVIITDPLINELEFSDESGKFKRKTVKLTRAEIPLRFNYSKTIKKIKVEKSGTEEALQTLFLSTLTF